MILLQFLIIRKIITIFIAMEYKQSKLSLKMVHLWPVNLRNAKSWDIISKLYWKIILCLMFLRYISFLAIEQTNSIMQHKKSELDWQLVP